MSFSYRLLAGPCDRQVIHRYELTLLELMKDESRVRGPFVGASAVVIREGRVLLGRRLGAHGTGTWAFPGGKVAPGENPTDTVARELIEETGLRATDIRPIHWTNDVFLADGLHYITLHYFVEAEGQPRVLEPDKAKEWQWFSLSELPDPLFLSARHLFASGWST